MYELQRTYRFSAGHQLHHHDGRCRNPHGHSYTLTIELKGNTLQKEGPKTGMLTDFSDIDLKVKPMIERYFDHQWLNDTLNSDNPSSEFIAYWIYKHLKPQLPLLHKISVSETTDSKATYQES